jgi:pyruvate/2-oxoglutarate/acetoin dehydrogenase E1 component
VRPGGDLTIVTAMRGVREALGAADDLARRGVECEVIDLRTLRPWDRDTVLASVRRTNRVLVVEEGPETGGWAGDVLATVTHEALDDLDDAWRLTTPDLPVPYSPHLEDAHFAGTERIVASVVERLAV